MKTDNIFHTLTSVTTALGRNAIPLGLFLFGGSSAETAMILYFLETLVGVILATVYVLLRAPAEDLGYAAISPSDVVVTVNDRVVQQHGPGSRKTLLQGFLIFAFGFTVVPGIFLIFWAVVQGEPISISAIGSGLAGIAMFQVINFIADFFFVGRLTPESADYFLQDSRGRIATIFLSIFVGLMVAMVFKVEWFVIPFAILKTIHDVAVFLVRKPVQSAGI